MPTSKPKTLRAILAEMGLAKAGTLFDANEEVVWVRWECPLCSERLVCYRNGPDHCPSCHGTGRRVDRAS